VKVYRGEERERAEIENFPPSRDLMQKRLLPTYEKKQYNSYEKTKNVHPKSLSSLRERERESEREEEKSQKSERKMSLARKI
jgi:hypothetical protein